MGGWYPLRLLEDIKAIDSAVDPPQHLLLQVSQDHFRLKNYPTIHYSKDEIGDWNFLCMGGMATEEQQIEIGFAVTENPVLLWQIGHLLESFIQIWKYKDGWEYYIETRSGFYRWVTSSLHPTAYSLVWGNGIP